MAGRKKKKKHVGLEVRLQVSSVLLPGSLKKGIMAGDSQATDQIKKFLKIKLSIRVEVQFLHHAVKDTRILLILCEGGQFHLHETQELCLGEHAVVAILASILLENGNQRLNAPLGLGGARHVACQSGIPREG